MSIANLRQFICNSLPILCQFLASSLRGRKSYTNAWETRKLGEVVEFYSGLTYSPDDVIYNAGTFVLRSSNINGGEIVDADNVYVNSDVVNCSNVKVGDVIVVVRNGSRNLIGKHAQVKTEMKNTVIGAFMTGLRSPQSEFVNTLLDTSQFDIEITKNLGATINQITTGAFKQMVFSMPTDNEEQTAIGTYFATLDTAIALHKRKLAGLRQLKRGYLQVMFPQAGERVPRVRCAGCSGEWEHSTISKTGIKVLSGFAFQSSTYVDEGQYKILTIANVKQGTLNITKCVTIEKLPSELQEHHQLKRGDIVISLTGNVGRSCFIDADGLLLNQRVGLFADITLDKYFFYSILQNANFADEMIANAQGGAQPNLSNKDIYNYAFSYPRDKAEQIAIGNFFRLLDNQITAQSQKVEQLQSLKKAYLQKMFI